MTREPSTSPGDDPRDPFDDRLDAPSEEESNLRSRDRDRDPSGSSSRRRFLGAVAAGVSAAVSGCSGILPSSDPDWPTLGCSSAAGGWPTAGGGPARTGSVDASLPELSDPRGIVDSRTSIRGEPVASPEGFYVPVFDGVRAYDPEGNLRWERTFEELYTELALSMGCGHLVAYSGNFTAILDPETGDVKWRTDTMGVNTMDGNQRVAVRDGTLYAGSSLDVRGFEFAAGEFSLDVPEVGGIVHGVAVDGRPVLSTKRGLRGIAEDGGEEGQGAVDWTYGTDRSWWGPAIDGGVAYAISEDGRAAAVDVEDGSERWFHDASEEIGQPRARVEGPGVSNDVVYSRPAVGPDRVYVPPGNAEHAVVLDRESGETVYTLETGFSHSPPLVGPDRVFFVAVNEGLMVVDRNSGEHLETTDWLPTSQPVFVDGTVYATLRNGPPVPEVVAFS